MRFANGACARGLVTALAILLVIFAGTLAYLGQTPPSKLIDGFEQSDQISFLAIGDQGRGQWPQRQVAAAMAAAVAADPNVRFCVLLGDNFYGNGVESTTDWQWRWKFESVYSAEPFWTTPFFAVLGNHDYLGNVQAQLDYSREQLGSNRFRLPATQYVRDFGQVGGRPLARLVFIDTNDSGDGFEATKQFIKRAFSSAEQDPLWRIVVAHHPVRSFGRYRDDHALQNALLSVLIEEKINLYLSGHDHNLQLVAEPGEPVFVVSGGGGSSSLYGQTGADSTLRYFNATYGYVKVDISEAGIQVELQPIGHQPPFIALINKMGLAKGATYRL